MEARCSWHDDSFEPTVPRREGRGGLLGENELLLLLEESLMLFD
jgi:hypothetical protein